MTDDYRKKLDEAAHEFNFNQNCTCSDPDSGVCWYNLPDEERQRYGFKAGAQFVLDNPPPEVEALVEAAERANEYVRQPYLDEALAPFHKGEG